MYILFICVDTHEHTHAQRSRDGSLVATVFLLGLSERISNFRVCAICRSGLIIWPLLTCFPQLNRESGRAKQLETELKDAQAQQADSRSQVELCTSCSQVELCNSHSQVEL